MKYEPKETPMWVFVVAILLNAIILPLLFIDFFSPNTLGFSSFDLMSTGIIAIVVGIFITVFILALLPNNRSRFLKIQRKLSTTPISKLKEGVVELEGNAVTQTPLQAPLNQKPCVAYHYSVEEQYRRKGSDKFREVHRETKYAPMVFKDATGEVAIQTEGLELISVAQDFQEFDPETQLRHTQYLLFEEDKVLLIGNAIQTDKWVIEQDKTLKIFGCMPSEKVYLHNTLRSLRRGMALFGLAYLLAMIWLLISPLYIKEDTLILEKPLFFSQEVNNFQEFKTAITKPFQSPYPYEVVFPYFKTEAEANAFFEKYDNRIVFQQKLGVISLFYGVIGDSTMAIAIIFISSILFGVLFGILGKTTKLSFFKWLESLVVILIFAGFLPLLLLKFAGVSGEKILFIWWVFLFITLLFGILYRTELLKYQHHSEENRS